MVVLVMETAPESMRGEMKKWLLEVRPGVMVGNVSALVREKIWEKVCSAIPTLDAVLIYTDKNEVGFNMEMTGQPQRSVVDFEGIPLIKIIDK